MRSKQKAKSRPLGLILLGLCVFYFLCALGIFILPFDVLARSSLARDFVEFALQIYPAVERAFSHTDFTQKAAFYIAYMGMVKVVTAIGFVAAFLLCSNKENIAYTLKRIIKENPVKRFLLSVFIIFVSCFFIYWDFSGYHIGYRHPRYSPEYEWVLKSPGELFWQMAIDFMFLIFVAGCIFYVALEIWLLFSKCKSA